MRGRPRSQTNPTTQQQTATRVRAPCRRHTARHRQIAQLAHVVADQGNIHRRPTKNSNAMRAATQKEREKKRATVSDKRAHARQRERSKIEDDRCKQRPRPQDVREQGAYCHCIAVRTCETHGHRHTNASAPVRLQAGTHEATTRTRDRQRITTMHPKRPMYANRALLSPPPPYI